MPTSSPHHSARILIVDDHPIVREGLEALISRETDLSVCGQAEGISEALDLASSTKPDLAIVDISLKDGSGIDLIRQLNANNPTLRVLVSSIYDEALYAERSLHAGAIGYISKQEATRSIITAIRQVLNGRIYLSDRMSQHLVRRMVGRERLPSGLSVDSLSDRELQVFTLVGSGLTTSQIADRLHLSVKTIETYRQRIKEKLDLSNAVELVRAASQWVLEHGS